MASRLIDFCEQANPIVLDEARRSNRNLRTPGGSMTV